MSINKIEIQDGSGNVYYPKTSIDSVIYSDRTSIEEKIRILEYRLNELKGQLADSINNKTGSSLTSNSTVDEMTVAINSIKTLEQATADGNATASNILVDKTAYVNGTKITGTMPNKEAVTASLNCGGSYTIPAGYHNGSGKVTANSLSSQTSANATASDILVDKTAYVNGTKVTGTMPNKGAVTASLNCGGSYTIPAGYHNRSGKVTANSLASQISNAGVTVTNPSQVISGYKVLDKSGNLITGTANKYKTATVSITGNARITVPSDGTRLIACFASSTGATNHGSACGFISFKISENNYMNFECKYTSNSTTTAIEPYYTNSTGPITSCKLYAGRDGSTLTRIAYIIYE